MILCDKCGSYFYPNLSDPFPSCNNPKVIIIDWNWLRKKKCKYFWRIPYEKGLKRLQTHLRDLIHYNQKRRFRIKPAIRTMNNIQNGYFEFRDYLFSREGMTK